MPPPVPEATKERLILDRTPGIQREGAGLAGPRDKPQRATMAI